MTRVAGRRYRRATVAGLMIGALGVLGVASVAAPSGAQEPAPTSTTAPEPPPETTTTAPTAPTAPTDPPGTTPDTTGTTTTDDTTGTTVPGSPGPEPSTTVPDASTQDLPPGPAAATLTLDPSGDLTDGTPVAVAASGLAPRQWVMAYQCISGSQDGVLDDEGCDFQDLTWGETDGTGSVTVTVRVDTLLTTGSEEPVTTDCRTADACSVVMFIPAPGATVTVEAPLHFTPDGPLAPPPAVAVAPADLLTDGQPVSVTGTGLVWSAMAFVVQCAADPTGLEDCDTETASEAVVDEAGSVVKELPVRAVIYTANGEVDCRDAGNCVVAVSADRMRSPQRRAVAPVSFEPGTPVLTPTLTATPATDLVDGQVVTVTGSGYLSEWVEVFLCGPTPSYDNCTWTESWAEIDETGAFTTEVTVEAIIPTEDGDVDCRTSPDPCLLVASSTEPDSARAGRTELHFTPDGPVPPAPVITVDPDTDLPDEATVTVSGANFRPDHEVDVTVCSVAEDWLCDPQAQAWTATDADGRFTAELDVAASFAPGAGGDTVDCRAAPGCQVVAASRGRQTTAPLSFGPPPPPGERYLDPVFDEVEVTRDVVYRHTTDASGASIELALDIYQPAGDTVTERPVVAWLHGGWFSWGDKADMAGYAEAFARRGYVAVSMEYRRRPGLDCCPTDDAEGVTDAILDAGDDAAAGVAWLRDHAEEYRVDPDAIAAGGVNGGATAAFNLAHIGGQMDRPAGSTVAAALPIAGVDLGRPDAGEAPVLAFHGDDRTAPLHLSQSTCRQARRVGGRCDAVGYAGVYDVAEQRQRDIVRRSSDFLAEVMLDPLGYVDWNGPRDPGSPPASTITPAAVARVVTGTLPRTGAEIARVAAVGLALTVLGATLVLARRRRLTVATALDPAADGGRTRLAAAAIVALVVVLAGVAVTSGTDLLSSSGDDDSDESADHDAMSHGDHGDHDDDGGTDHDDADHGDHDRDDHDDGAMAHDDMDHDGDHDDMDHADATAGHAAHGPHDALHTSGAGHGDGHDAMPTAAHDDHGPASDPGHQHDPTGTTVPGHQHPPTDTTTPGHQHPPTTVPGDPPDDGFDPDWTPEQTAYAQALVDDTEAGLRQYSNPAILPLLGYQWILDGQAVGDYQHWIHLSRIVDGQILDPDRPESLVFRNAEDGPVLEAAMYMLPPGYTLATVPADIAWLPGWHIHDNLCFEDGFKLVGVTVNGVCPRGYVVVTPPMLHVWAVDTRCGRFAGVDENGLQCHHDHDGH